MSSGITSVIVMGMASLIDCAAQKELEHTITRTIVCGFCVLRRH